MKKRFLISALTIVIMVFAFAVTHAQAPTVTINYNATSLVPGSTIQVPVVLNGNNVGNWRILIRYDRDVLTYTGQTNTMTALGIGFFSVSNFYTIQTGYPNAGETVLVAGLAYTAGAPGYSYANQNVVTFNFTFNGGTTNFEFVNISAATSQSSNNHTYVKAEPYNVVNLTTVYTNGSAQGAYGELHSVATGGPFVWGNAASWVENKTPSRAYNVFVTGDEVQIAAAGRCHDLTIMEAGKLTLNSGQALTINGNFKIESDATSTGSFVDKGTVTIAGTSTVERYTTGNWDGTWPPASITWHYVSSPVSGSTINSYLNSLLNYWSEPTNVWEPLTLPLTTPLLVGTGYSAATRTNQVITFDGGTLNTGTKVLPLTNTPGTDARGFNLVGNPYPSPIQWDGTIGRSNVDGSAYLWNGNTYTAYLVTDVPANVIPAEQGFFVHVTTGTFNGSLTLANSNRVHSAAPYVKSSGYEYINLAVAGNDMNDMTSVRFNEEATDNFDIDYDAYKLWGTDNCPQIYSTIPGKNLAVNSLTSRTSQTVIPVGFKTGQSGTFTITASGFESFPAGTEVFLTDLVTGETQNLAVDPEYTFDANAGGATQRFTLQFTPVGMPEGSSSAVKIYAFEKQIYVNVPTDLEGTITVYSMLGKTLDTRPIQPNSLNKLNLDLTSGYYIVKVQGDKDAVTGKVFIR